MSASHRPATSLRAGVIAGASFLALLTGCITAEAPTTQELATIDKATVTLMPASAAERAMADKQDVLTQAKFWATEYDKNPNEYEAALKYARVLRGIGSSPRAAEVARQALTLKQGDVDLTLIYAQASLDVGKAEDAAYALARAEANGQTDWRLLSIIGVTMDTLDQHGPAQDYYRKALAISPDNPRSCPTSHFPMFWKASQRWPNRRCGRPSARPGADSRITQNLILALGVQGKFEEVETAAGTDPAQAMVDANRDYFRSLLNASRTWETLRGSKN